MENIRYGGVDRSDTNSVASLTVNTGDNEAVDVRRLNYDNGNISPQAYSSANVGGIEGSVLQISSDRSEGQVLQNYFCKSQIYAFAFRGGYQMTLVTEFFITVGVPSPSGRSPRPADAGDLKRSQTFGQRIMGNMMDNLFLRNLTSKSQSQPSDASQPPSPAMVLCWTCSSVADLKLSVV